MENFRVNLCFETSQHRVQTADDNNKDTSQILQLTLVLYIFKLVLYFNSIIISNQIKYYFAINGGDFCWYIQHGFSKHALQIHYQSWRSVIESASTKTQGRTRLFGASRWNVIKALLLSEIVHVNLFLWQEELNAQGSDKDWWYFTS